MQAQTELSYYTERTKFDDSKAGVKGLVDAGTLKIPPFFVEPENKVSSNGSVSASATHLQIPVIDLKDVHEDTFRRQEIIEKIRDASETWGFFQVVNHGIPKDVMEEMVEGVRRFHEQPKELKMEYYSRDSKKNVKYNSNLQLYKVKVANWRDSLYFSIPPDGLDAEEFPTICREITIKYSENVRQLGLTLLELLSESLGLKHSHLIDIECAKGHSIVGHYYPPCPEPDRTLGTSPHNDPSFITIVQQDNIGGLQVFHQDQWVDIPPIPDTFVVNIGDLLQLVSNDKFKSAQHRVLANHIGPRISLAFFFVTYFHTSNRIYGPIKELLSDKNPPLFRETRVIDYIATYTGKGLNDVTHLLDHFRL